MKILVISNTPWNNSNSFGNTFSNMFDGMQDVEIYNICCRHGESNNSIVKQAVQMTDKAVLKSAYSFKYDPCWKIETTNETSDENEEVSIKARQNRKTISFIIRDLIWKIGRWKRSKTLLGFINEIKPDIIYLPIYASPHICRVQNFIIKKLGVPVVGHISDDVYGVPPKASLLAKLYRRSLRRNLRKLFSKCQYLEVFAENMQEEYSRLFGIKCHLIGKGVSKEIIDKIRINV